MKCENCIEVSTQSLSVRPFCIHVHVTCIHALQIIYFNFLFEKKATTPKTNKQTNKTQLQDDMSHDCTQQTTKIFFLMEWSCIIDQKLVFLVMITSFLQRWSCFYSKVIITTCIVTQTIAQLVKEHSHTQTHMHYSWILHVHVADFLCNHAKENVWDYTTCTSLKNKSISQPVHVNLQIAPQPRCPSSNLSFLSQLPLTAYNGVLWLVYPFAAMPIFWDHSDINQI